MAPLKYFLLPVNASVHEHAPLRRMQRAYRQSPSRLSLIAQKQASTRAYDGNGQSLLCAFLFRFGLCACLAAAGEGRAVAKKDVCGSEAVYPRPPAVYPGVQPSPTLLHRPPLLLLLACCCLCAAVPSVSGGAAGFIAWRQPFTACPVLAASSACPALACAQRGQPAPATLGGSGIGLAAIIAQVQDFADNRAAARQLRQQLHAYPPVSDAAFALLSACLQPDKAAALRALLESAPAPSAPQAEAPGAGAAGGPGASAAQPLADKAAVGIAAQGAGKEAGQAGTAADVAPMDAEPSAPAPAQKEGQPAEAAAEPER
jgi:hypothetical protein